MRRLFVVELIAALISFGALGAQVSSDGGDARPLPIVEVAPAASATALAIFISGDGGWAELDRAVSAELVRRGVSVVGIDARAYLGRRPTPDVLGHDVARVAREYMSRWRLDRLALVGYSRGADLVPFAATRLDDDLRAHLALVAMLGLATEASFEFHWIDLVRDVHRAADLPILPELERLGDVTLFCVYGTREKDSLCRDAPLPRLVKVAREGGHHFDGDYPAIAREIVTALR
jgi:type IV secretory pathway VirJ component